ncbi:Succinylglutamate desuccinylase / Aspartoacylase family protein [Halopelagius inordinatus]|uniref:Succinylglutamate desuccinylase / Aspartoacylase family protein n=1 Tax=Halopelagius inordinatus TaxID=553467 RepID=A0A1I2R1R9_9EURY|nr:succinylglutamate desuccinylase/aspartoacylase family protein [Halopelagius inordinatus]SFG34624.1 Succinylglutamate desuccinylase / Aspartoacylase family protein [Halopelagius inordinatus]
MQIYELGEGTPEVAVVGTIHGDEPCGVRAIERFVATEPDVERPVKLVVANEEALEANVRYLEEDLNRVFPGDPNADSHERRLAHDLLREVRGCTTLSLHSTQSYGKPFALVDTVGAVSRSICPFLPIEELVETAEFVGGRLIDHAHTIDVECGLQGTDEAAENAYWLVRAFLAATGVLAAPLEEGTEAPLSLERRGADEVAVYRMLERIPKEPASTYEVFVDNFELVSEGDRFAAADDREFTADRDFYPVLLSAYGYEDVFGFAADKVGTLA